MRVRDQGPPGPSFSPPRPERQREERGGSSSPSFSALILDRNREVLVWELDSPTP